MSEQRLATLHTDGWCGGLRGRDAAAGWSLPLPRALLVGVVLHGVFLPAIGGYRRCHATSPTKNSLLAPPCFGQRSNGVRLMSVGRGEGPRILRVMVAWFAQSMAVWWMRWRIGLLSCCQAWRFRKVCTFSTPATTLRAATRRICELEQRRTTRRIACFARGTHGHAERVTLLLG